MRAVIAIILTALLGGGGSPTISVFTEDALCDGARTADQRSEVLGPAVLEYLRGKSVTEALAGRGPARCVRLTAISGAGGGGLVAYAWTGRDGTPALFARPDGGGWQTTTLDLAGWETGGYPVGGTVTFPGGKPDLLLAMQGSGSGGIGQLLHATLDPEGKLHSRAVTPVFDHARFDFIEPHLVLLTYRGASLGPTAWSCNACLPVNHQQLLRWEEEAGILQTVGRRIVPEPYLTANLLLGALQAGDQRAAARYLTRPDLFGPLAQALGLPAAKSVPWQTSSGFTAESPEWRIRDLELRNWDLLPPKYRTVLPADLRTYDFPLEQGKERVLLHMVRREGGWSVSGSSTP